MHQPTWPYRCCAKTRINPPSLTLASTDPGHNRNHSLPVTKCAFKLSPWDEEWLRNYPPERSEDGPYAFLRHVQRYHFRSHWKHVHPRSSSDHLSRSTKPG